MMIRGLEKIHADSDLAVFFKYSDLHLPITLTDDEFIAAMKEIERDDLEFIARAAKQLGVATVKIAKNRTLHLNG